MEFETMKRTLRGNKS